MKSIEIERTKLAAAIGQAMFGNKEVLEGHDSAHREHG